MGLSNLPILAEGLVMNTVVSLAGIKNTVRSILGSTNLYSIGSDDDDGDSHQEDEEEELSRARRVSITRYDSLCRNRAAESSNSSGIMECCVCLCRFEAKQEVSELSCKHFFHTGCLDKWFHNHHTTCPLCRSVL